MFKISDKELDKLLTLADDRECEKLTRAREYNDTLNMKYLDLRGKDLSGRKFWNVDFTKRCSRGVLAPLFLRTI